MRNDRGRAESLAIPLPFRVRLHRSHLIPIILLALFAASCTRAPREIGPAAPYSTVARELSAFIERELTDKGIDAMAVALVDDQQIVFARGFGQADPDSGRPATARTVWRVGSVSKLFTDIAVMQLVERGELDLDAPVTRYVPSVRPGGADGHEITLRQLTSHRAGLVREPPVGHYFDDSTPSLAATVESLNDTQFAYPPGSVTKYSNAGIALVGYSLEATLGEPFADIVARSVLDPIGMRDSAFTPRPDLVERLARAKMWSYDGREFVAPTFELGMAPAGSLYSTVGDLGRFMMMLFNEGSAGETRVLAHETLEAMWRPQFAPEGAVSAYGIGFNVDQFEGRRRVGHGGAIYGFATQLSALPEDKLGVVVIANADGANAVTSRVASTALSMMLAARAGESPQAPAPYQAVGPNLARRLEGLYIGPESSIELVERAGQLKLRLRDRLLRLRATDDGLIADDRLGHGPRIRLIDEGVIQIAGQNLTRVVRSKPAPAPDRWRALIGEYGWEHNVLFIHERAGRLHALIEWFFDYPLTEIAPDRFAFPDYGLYPGEFIEFKRDASGRATEALTAGIPFARREIGTSDGETFRIDPLAPADELRAEALAARPPREKGDFRETDLVDLVTLAPDIKFDIRYASTNNFMSTVFYDQARAFMQRPAAEALLAAHRSLAPKGYGLLIHDAYRPWYVTKMFWDATPDAQRMFVADPSQGSRHNRGCAVDLTLYDLATGEPVQMVGGYDEMSERSYPDYQGGTELQRWRRALLHDAMRDAGFEVYEFEWWHFDYKDWRAYRIGNLTFDQIPDGGRN